MVSIITGDIINSRKVTDQQSWITPLKKILKLYGKSPGAWEIFRGDSFQVEIADAADSLLAAIRIKATVKTVRQLDVRMAIGIGEKTFEAARITEANGEAFVNSGEKFEELKKLRLRLAMKSPWPSLDEQMNLMLSLASIAMDNWTAGSAEMIALSLKYHNLSQKQLGKKLDISQSSVSERQTRAHYSEITELERFYRQIITNQSA